MNDEAIKQIERNAANEQAVLAAITAGFMDEDDIRIASSVRGCSFRSTINRLTKAKKIVGCAHGWRLATLDDLTRYRKGPKDRRKGRRVVLPIHLHGDDIELLRKMCRETKQPAVQVVNIAARLLRNAIREAAR